MLKKIIFSFLALAIMLVPSISLANNLPGMIQYYTTQANTYQTTSDDYAAKAAIEKNAIDTVNMTDKNRAKLTKKYNTLIALINRANFDINASKTMIATEQAGDKYHKKDWKIIKKRLIGVSKTLKAAKASEKDLRRRLINLNRGPLW